MEISESTREFVFDRRPTPVPGDMRIAWRVSLCLLILSKSRAKKASFAKLHLLNDAMRSAKSQEKLIDLISGQAPYHSWRTRVEPAFSRALDFVVGEGFATWVISSERTSMKLSALGSEASKAILDEEGVLDEEKQFLEKVKSDITEGFVKNVILSGTRLL